MKESHDYQIECIPCGIVIQNPQISITSKIPEQYKEKLVLHLLEIRAEIMCLKCQRPLTKKKEVSKLIVPNKKIIL